MSKPPNLYPELGPAIDAAYERHNPTPVDETPTQLEEVVTQSLSLLEENEDQRQLNILEEDLLEINGRIHSLNSKPEVTLVTLQELLAEKEWVSRDILQYAANIAESTISEKATEAIEQITINYDRDINIVSSNPLTRQALADGEVEIKNHHIPAGINILERSIKPLHGQETTNSIIGQLALDYLRKCLQKNPDDPKVVIAILGHFGLDENNNDRIRAILDAEWMNAFASLDSNDPEFRHKALNLKSVITLENLNYFLTLYNHNFMTNKYYNKQRKNGEALYLVQINTLEQDSEDNEIILGIIYREVLETALNFTLNDKKLDGKELIDKCCTDPIIKSLMLKALKLN